MTGTAHVTIYVALLVFEQRSQGFIGLAGALMELGGLGVCTVNAKGAGALVAQASDLTLSFPQPLWCLSGVRGLSSMFQTGESCPSSKYWLTPESW